MNRPESEQDDGAATARWVVRHFRALAMVAAGAAALVTSHVTTKLRIDDLEKRLAAAEATNTTDSTRFDALEKQLATLNHKLDVVLLCTHDPHACEQQLRLLGSIQ